VAANLRNIDLSHISLDELNQVTSIGTFWDTLGWVYFQKGDLASAERYIRSAWTLNQHGEVADHLAQIYEKLGRRQDAIHTFALAATAPHGVPETREHLTAILGHDPKDLAIKDLKTELSRLRTIDAENGNDIEGIAEFFVLLAPTGGSAKAEAVRFISGDAQLRPLADRLGKLDYGPMFPDKSPVRLVRRGTLSCSKVSGDCLFTLTLPEDVRTLN
jgi:tetratricopeptide (TPR) repeat protein